MFTIPSVTANSLLNREPRPTLYCDKNTSDTDNLVLKSTLSLWDRLDMFWNTKEGDIPKWIPVRVVKKNSAGSGIVDDGYLNYGKLYDDYGLYRNSGIRCPLENKLKSQVNHRFIQDTTNTIAAFLNTHSQFLIR